MKTIWRNRIRQVTGLGVALALVVIIAGCQTTASLTGTAQAASVDAVGITAVKVVDFLNSIGACTHISQSEDSPAEVAAALKYTGIRNIRDDGSTNPEILQRFIEVHKISGARVSLLPINGNIAASLFEYETLAAEGALLAAEGPNEPNNWHVTYQGQTSSDKTSLPIAWFQRDLYSAVKADPKLKGIPVFHSSESGGSEPDNCGLQFLTIPKGAGTLMPDGTKYADYANVHNYVCDHLGSNIADNSAWNATSPTPQPGWDGLWVEYGHTWWGRGFDGYSVDELATLPKVSTETGWTTSGEGSITEEQQGRVFMNLYLAGFKQGFKHTFIYMLHDSRTQGNWGLVKLDYTPKLSATYLHNLTTILADKSSVFTPRKVNYTISNKPETVHDLLMQKSNGQFELAVWSERVAGTNDVTVNLGSKFGSVKVYDPTVGTAVTQTLKNVSSVPLTLSDHPVIIEFLPGR